MARSHARLVRFAFLFVLLCCGLWTAVRCRLAFATPSALAEYHAVKYPPWQKRLVASCVDDIMPHASVAERRQAVEETLAFFHVVYHPTRSHAIENNVAVTRRYADEIALACERFGVPKAMAFAILTWENSGGTSATSYAACVGMGQLSDGALAQAHRLGRRFARLEIAAGGLCMVVADVLDVLTPRNPVANVLRGRAAFLGQRAREMDLSTVHDSLRRQAGVKDERAVPRANIEDSVVFMRYLLEMYGGRADLAISAYHNGVGNNDDLLADYLKRVEPRVAVFTPRARAPLFDALRRRRISYVSLWNDLRCRQMLNGLRTMDGEVTTPANASQAMGDESDIYLWKTLAALAATRATPEQLAALVVRYEADQGEAETAGLACAVRLVDSRGLRVTPEMHGYLKRLEERVRRADGHKAPPLSVSVAHESASHRAGVAVDLTMNSASLRRLLNEDWLFDRIYKNRLPDGRLHICLNPRFGREFLAGAKQGAASTR